MDNLRILVALVALLALAACNGKSESDTDGGGLPGKGPLSCNCASDEYCIEYFDGLCNPVGTKPQCMTRPTSCKSGDACSSCGGTLCGPSKCCDKADCSWGYLKACRNADSSKNYITCTGQ